MNSTFLKIWIVLLFGLGLYVTYSFARLDAIKTERERYGMLLNDRSYQIDALSSELGDKLSFIETLNSKLQEINNSKVSLEVENTLLSAKVAGAQDSLGNFPFRVPSTGTLGSYAGAYGGNMYGFRHLGVDIWTTTDNNGQTGTHSGNAVYSACDGVVDNMDAANGAITVKCDPIPESYDVPERQVYTYYAHMGNAETKQLYIKVTPSHRISKGDLIGYQGDISKFFPQMRNVHLHFSVFAGLSETDKSKGAYNPCLYIGGDCMKRGSRFEI